jgi:DNA-binding NarL/FixJ family response regulator
MRDTIEVLLVEPHAGMRHTLRWVLDREDGIHVLGEAADALAAVRSAARKPFSVALVDSRLVALGSTTTVDALKYLARRAPVIVMGMEDAALYAAPYMAAGAHGYWMKSDDVGALTELLRSAAERRRSAA